MPAGGAWPAASSEAHLDLHRRLDRATCPSQDHQDPQASRDRQLGQLPARSACISQSTAHLNTQVVCQVCNRADGRGSTHPTHRCCREAWLLMADPWARLALVLDCGSYSKLGFAGNSQVGCRLPCLASAASLTQA